MESHLQFPLRHPNCFFLLSLSFPLHQTTKGLILTKPLSFFVSVSLCVTFCPSYVGYVEGDWLKLRASNILPLRKIGRIALSFLCKLF